MLSPSSPSIARPPLRAVGGWQRSAYAHRGFTLAELVVALVVGGAALAAFALVTAREERTHRELAARIRARAQLREGIALLLSDIRPLSQHGGDLVVGSALDSSLELRSVLGTTIVCRVNGSSVTTALESFVTPPTPGDTVWLFLHDTLGGSWVPFTLTAASMSPSRARSDCGGHSFAGSAYAGRSGAGARYTLSVAEPLPPTVDAGTPIRATRLVRYSLYRAPDARWYLGRREWSPSRTRFEIIQPVSGPYRGYASETSQSSGLELHYFDQSGAPVPSGSSATDRISSIGLTLRSPPPRLGASPSERRDALSVAVALRNRP